MPGDGSSAAQIGEEQPCKWIVGWEFDLMIPQPISLVSFPQSPVYAAKWMLMIWSVSGY